MAASASFQSHPARPPRGGSRWSSPERTVVWTEPPPSRSTTSNPNNHRSSSRKVAVVYYLCRHDGHLDHPHFMELHLPHARQPCLRDFTDRLNTLRGDGMAAMYSWSSKRSYRNGYVWHDLADDDLLAPAAGEYVLKGSHSHQLPHELQLQDTSTTTVRAGLHKNWSSFDLADSSYKLPHISAATQTDDDRRASATSMRMRRQPDPRTELPIDEISPPPSSSSPDDNLQCDRREEVGVIAGGRMRASAVLMQLISCGSVAVKDRGLPRGRSDLSSSSSSRHRSNLEKEAAEKTSLDCSFSVVSGGGDMERDYFSGSLVETNKTTTGIAAALSLRRSSSYTADRGLKLELKSEELDGGRGRCIPRKPSRSSPAAANGSSSSSATATAAHAESSADTCDGRVEDGQDKC